MNKVIFKIFLTAFFFLTSFNQAFAEIIDIQNEEKTFGELSPKQKDVISHRAKAFALMGAWFKENGFGRG